MRHNELRFASDDRAAPENRHPGLPGDDGFSRSDLMEGAGQHVHVDPVWRRRCIRIDSYDCAVVSIVQLVSIYQYYW